MAGKNKRHGAGQKWRGKRLGWAAGETEKVKISLGCRTEREEFKNRHREHDSMTERKKGERAGEHCGGETTMTGSGRKVWRKKKYQGREKGKKGQLAGQRDRENKGWERERGKERKAEKPCKRKQGTRTARKKKKEDRDLDRDGEKSKMDRGKETVRATGSRAEKERSGQRQDGDGEGTLGMVNRTEGNRSMGRDWDKGIE